MNHKNKGIIEIIWGIVTLPIFIYCQWVEFDIVWHLPPHEIYSFPGLPGILAIVSLTSIEFGYMNLTEKTGE